MSSRYRRHPLAATAVLTLLLGFMGVAGPGASTGQEPAMLVTQAQVEAELGVGVEVEPRGEGYSYTLTEGVGAVTIDMTPVEAVTMMGNGKDPIAGLGDQAFFMSSSSRMAILLARKGNQGITVSVQFPIGVPDGVEDAGETAQTIAALALEGL